MEGDLTLSLFSSVLTAYACAIPASKVQKNMLAFKRLLRLPRKSLDRALVLDTLEGNSPPLPCYFANVPVEILIPILSHAVDRSNKTLFALCAVCRRWREILFDVPQVWRNLILTESSYWAPDKVDAWLRRARGSLSRLYVGGECEVLAEDYLYKRIPWSSLRELRVDSISDTTELLLEAIADLLQVESLVLSQDDPDYLYFLGMMDTKRLRSFVCRVRYRVLPLNNVASSSLTKLELSGRFSTLELLVLLDRNPMIEKMVLADAWTIVGDDPVVGAGSIELVHLTHLELSNCCRSDTILRAIRILNVKTLILRSTIGDTCIQCVNIIASRRVLHLEEFRLVICVYHHQDLITILRNAPALKILSIQNSIETTGKADLVIHTLASANHPGTSTTPIADGTLCCPQLQKVVLSEFHGLSSSSLLGLVDTRLNGVSSDKHRSHFRGGEEIQPLPILSLYVDQCLSLRKRDLKWLREHVADFRYGRAEDV